MKEGYVYIIYNPELNLTKIGRTYTLKNERWGYHISSQPYPLMVIGVFKCGDYCFVEKELHRRFKDRKVRTEWFLVNYMEVLDELCKIDNTATIETTIEQLLENAIQYHLDAQKLQMMRNGVVPKLYGKGLNVSVERAKDIVFAGFKGYVNDVLN